MRSLTGREQRYCMFRGDRKRSYETKVRALSAVESHMQARPDDPLTVCVCDGCMLWHLTRGDADLVEVVGSR